MLLGAVQLDMVDATGTVIATGQGQALVGGTDATDAREAWTLGGTLLRATGVRAS